MTDASAETLYCANHPQTGTRLRCNRCSKPICTKCAVLTPVGYRCRECVRGQQQIFETAKWYDLIVAVVIGAPLGGLSAALLGGLGFFTILLGPIAGGVTAEIVRVAVRRRRSRYLALAAAAAFAAGCLAVTLLPVLILGLGLLLGSGRGFGPGAGRLLIGFLWPILYTVLATSTVFARLRGIAIG